VRASPPAACQAAWGALRGGKGAGLHTSAQYAQVLPEGDLHEPVHLFKLSLNKLGSQTLLAARLGHILGQVPRKMMAQLVHREAFVEQQPQICLVPN
jgi:hypothetical protein